MEAEEFVGEMDWEGETIDWRIGERAEWVGVMYIYC